MSEENLRRAQLLLDECGSDWSMLQELVAFIKRPELRKVAETTLKLHRSFSSTTVLRKLLEADEALSRAIALHVTLEAREEFGEPEATTKERSPEDEPLLEMAPVDTGKPEVSKLATGTTYPKTVDVEAI